MTPERADLRANNRQKPPDPSYEPLEVMAEFTIWLDDEHIRRIRSEWTVSGEHASGSTIRTFDLWDFGVANRSFSRPHRPLIRYLALPCSCENQVRGQEKPESVMEEMKVRLGW